MTWASSLRFSRAVRRHAGQASAALPPADSTALRLALMRSYCDEYLGRWPEQGEFVQQLRRDAEWANLVGLVWGWASASDPGASAACLDSSRQNPIAPGFARLLRTANRLGFSAANRPAACASRAPHGAVVAHLRLSICAGS